MTHAERIAALRELLSSVGNPAQREALLWAIESLEGHVCPQCQKRVGVWYAGDGVCTKCRPVPGGL